MVQISWGTKYGSVKLSGECPIIGVSTFLSSKGWPTILPKQVIRATEEEKEARIVTVENLLGACAEEAAKAIRDLQQAAVKNENMFAVLMEATKYCSLGQHTQAMCEEGGSTGGIYRVGMPFPESLEGI